MNHSPSNESYQSYQSNMGESIRKVFCTQKCRLRSTLMQRMQSVDSCEVIHKKRLALDKNQDPLKQLLKMLSFGNAMQFLIILFSLAFFYVIWAARMHNHALLFGNGGCLSTSYWTDKDCKVVF